MQGAARLPDIDRQFWYRLIGGQSPASDGGQGGSHAGGQIERQKLLLAQDLSAGGTEAGEREHVA